MFSLVESNPASISEKSILAHHLAHFLMLTHEAVRIDHPVTSAE